MAEVNFLVKKGLTVPKGSASTPSVIFDASDPNTGLYSPGADQVAVVTNGNQRITVDSSGRLLVGTSSSSRLVTQILQGNSTNSTTQAVLFLGRGAASPAINQSLGAIEFGDSNHDAAASIVARRDTGTWTPGSSHPGRIEFSTTANGASSPTERMRLTSSGQLLVGATTAPNSETFAVDGSSAIENLNGSTVVSVRQNDTVTITYSLRSTETGMMFISYSPSSTQTPWGAGGGDGLYLSIYFGNLANTRANDITHDSGRSSTTRDGAISVSASGGTIVITKTAGTAANSGNLSIGVVSGHRIRQPVVT